MKYNKLLSLCIPTNGIEEWVFPVLESIYSQNISEELYEVIVTDNGQNEHFQSKIADYRKFHSNLHYKKTSEKLFVNEITSYQCATGKFIKFINHRTMLLPGTLAEYINFVKKYEREKPVVYFSNGVLKLKNDQRELSDFDAFIRTLSYYSSWSTGMGFWKEDFDKLPKDTVFNELFPHTNILFAERKKQKYIIDDRELLKEIPSKNKKGTYDLFYAFAVDYPSILLELVCSGNLAIDSFLKVKNELLYFIAGLYFDFVLQGVPSSYITSNSSAIKVYYNQPMFYIRIGEIACRRFLEKVIRIVKR